MSADPFHTRSLLQTEQSIYSIYRLDKLAEETQRDLSRLPYCIRILLESALRNDDGSESARGDILNLVNWQAKSGTLRPAVSFYPARVILQDFTGVPVVVDLAAMRSAAQKLGIDPQRVNPVIPVDLVIDHSLQVDFFGSPDALGRNAALEFERNRERYEFLRWSQEAFDHFKVTPPATGIIHQVNLEYLARVAMTRTRDGETCVFPDTVLGTDSHTTMINGLGVLGWGVGGIEAISAMMGQPVDLVIPDVIGVRLTGRLPEGATPTDLTLMLTQLLRKRGVVEKFIEYFGPGVNTLTLADRAMIANMTPENGATVSYFPVDGETLAYLRFSGRSEAQMELAEACFRALGLFREEDSPEPRYTEVIELDLGSVQPCLAGPKRPQDRVPLAEMQSTFRQALRKPKAERGYELKEDALDRTAAVDLDGGVTLGHGSVLIAAITSCTNTSNPYVMIAAGLLAKKAVEKGLKVPSYVKTSLAPGSRVVTRYLAEAGLLKPLAQLGFDVVGYGCTTCIGNSGPLAEAITAAVRENGLVAAAVLSGNRNFEGRIHPATLANYLASPPLVVAYALAGTVDIDLTRQPIGTGSDGKPVYLRDIYPSSQEIEETIRQALHPQMFRASYSDVYSGSVEWQAIQPPPSSLYPWNPASTYIQEPPYFAEMPLQPPAELRSIEGARALAVLGDSVTTDHISPAGSIPANSPAGKYLLEKGVPVSEFNSYGSRRGNDRVMVRGTLANIRLKNQLVPGVEGGVTLHLPDGEQMSIYDAAMRYRQEGVPLIILAGKEYGTGSSRDWAAKGVMLLGVRAVIAESFERIHRSNLIGMGVLPLQFLPGEGVQSLGLTGHEVFTIMDLSDALKPGAALIVQASRADGSLLCFKVRSRVDTAAEAVCLRNGGILQTILYGMR